MHYAAEVGWAEMARVMAEVAGESPGSWALADRLRRALEGEME
jgi:3-hydroxyacyl-CoA dehydrogenase